jgi:hypothetical protein
LLSNYEVLKLLGEQQAQLVERPPAEPGPSNSSKKDALSTDFPTTFASDDANKGQKTPENLRRIQNDVCTVYQLVLAESLTLCL